MPQFERQPCVYQCDEDACRGKRAQCFRSWGRHLLQARERDGAELATRLHDQLAQQLAGIKFSLLAAIEAGDMPSRSRSLADSIAQLDASMGLARDLSMNCYPDSLRALGVLQALRARLDELSCSSELVFDIELPETMPALGEAAEEALFRIADEAVRNALCHAMASVVRVEVQTDAETVRLAVRDDGRGLELRDGLPEDRRRWGLMEMQERALLSGATLRFEAVAEGGTRVSCAWPIPGARSPA